MSLIIGIIPARFGSTRFPGKPLAKIGHKTMIEWTYIHSSKSKLLNKIYVATDDSRIEAEVLSFGGNVIMTSPNHPTGTDRLIEVTKKFPDASIIVNIQGDEPGIESELIDGVIQLKKDRRDWEMTSAAVKINDNSELKDPNRVKVVFDKNNKALYFSRSLIPSLFKKNVPVYRHLGIYCYERECLLNYNNLPESDLENSESLEQLRALDAGLNIGIFIASKSGLSVDIPEDLELVKKDFANKKIISLT